MDSKQQEQVTKRNTVSLGGGCGGGDPHHFRWPCFFVILCFVLLSVMSTRNLSTQVKEVVDQRYDILKT